MPELATTGKGLASSAQGAFTLPIMLRGEVIGTIDLESSESNQDWSEENISMVKSVAERVGLALDNARLFEETRQRGVELTTLNQIISSASQTLDLHALLDMVLRQTLEAFGFDGGLITVYNETRQKLERIVRTGLPGEIPNEPAEGLENSLCAYVFNSKVPLVIEDFRRGAPVDVSDEIEAGYHSYMGVPLEAKGRVLGTWCGFRKFAGPFSQNTLALLQAVGRQVGFAIENARLFEQTRRRAQREARLSRIAQQLRQATDIDSILQTATEELSQALGTSHAQAQLGVPTSQTDRPNGNGTGGSNA